MSALIKVNPTIDENQLQQLGAIVGTKAGDIWTVRIPETQMMAFTQIAGIDFIDLDSKIHPLMDSVRYVSGIDSVHRGFDMPMLSGKGVVVGILDGDFDYTHPTFYDTSYSTLRLKRVWDQRISGVPPAGYSYGAELKDTLSMLQKQSSNTTGDHGMTVSSIAAGSGYGSGNNRQFRGIAYDSDIVLVEFNADTNEFGFFTYATMIDGLAYIFNYAESVGKPAVINVSIGSQGGPHDGTSLFCRACDNLAGQGKIIVFAAGNEGLLRQHLQKSFTGSDTILSTIVPTEEGDDVDLWGDAGKSYCVEVGLFSNGIKGAKTQTICIDNIYRVIPLIGKDNDTCLVSIVSEINALNNKPHISIRLKQKSNDSIYVTAKATEGTVHLWRGWDFIGNGSWASEGDARYSVGEFACTKSSITVGAYSSRTTVKNIQNQTWTIQTSQVKTRGDIALFSSIGPTMDGRMKPDITAPGSLIGSATNSFSPQFKPGGSIYFATVTRYFSPRTNRNYYYAMTQGTSVAAPVVTGAVALMLQVNPDLTVDDIRNILIATAIKDSFTTPNPNPAIWGAGKLNVYGAVKSTISSYGKVPVPKEGEIRVYPNPSNDVFSMVFESESPGYFMVEISNVLGQTIKSEPWQLKKGVNQLSISLSGNEKGTYFISFTGQGGQMVKKVILGY